MIKTYRNTLTAVRALRRNMLRAILTALGIIIGVAAVIALMEFGSSVRKAVQQSIDSMGATTFYVFPGAAASSGISFGGGSGTTLTAQDAQAIKDQCPSVMYAVPIVRTRAQLVYGDRNWSTNRVEGSTPDYFSLRNWDNLDAGEIYTDRDVRGTARVCLIGQTVLRELFDGRPEEAIGKEIRIKNVGFKVIGVLSSKGANMMGFDEDDIVCAPWTSVKYRLSGMPSDSASSSASSSSSSSSVNTLNNPYPSGGVQLYPKPSEIQQANTPMLVRFANVERVYVGAKTVEVIPRATQEIIALLRDRHHRQDNEPDDFNIRNFMDMARSSQENSDRMSNLLLYVGALSLLVGGVGIMNIMLVSVTERTREIGLRMAVGARPGDILWQFLVEALLLCLSGGLLGIVAGRVTSMVIAYYKQIDIPVSIPAMVIAAAVSASVGIIFGFYPAWKASRLDPIEALRFE